MKCKLVRCSKATSNWTVACLSLACMKIILKRICCCPRCSSLAYHFATYTFHFFCMISFFCSIHQCEWMKNNAVIIFCSNPDFAMFDSMLNHRDLIFQDATVRLIQINSTQQNYIDYLGPQFVRAMQRMENIDCVTGSRAATSASFNLFNIFIATLSIITLSVTV